MTLSNRARSVLRFAESGTLILLALVCGAVWAFVELADEVLEGSTHAFDEAVLLALRTPADLADPLGPGWLEEMGRDFTALGGIAVLTIVTLAVSGFLWLQGKGKATLFVIVSVGGGVIVSTILKEFFDRPRPDLVPHESIVYSASFPSGHSMMAAVAYLTLGALLVRVQPHRALRVYLFGLAVLLTVLVGASRVYLGVHWPTDVLAGWTVGAAWALSCSLVARALQRRGMVEQEGEGQVKGED